MKKLFIAAFVLISSTSFSQKQNVVVEGVSPNLYITHIVAPKEGYYSLGRLYNQAPKSIAALNNSTLEKGLAIGQTIKIPVNTLNYDVTGVGQSGETLVALYHLVSKNETLFRIGNNYAVSLDNVRKWNKLSSDVIEVGTPLVVGNLRVKSDQLTAFNNIVAPQISAATNIQTTAAITEAKHTEAKVAEPKTTEVKPEQKTAIATNAEPKVADVKATNNAIVTPTADVHNASAITSAPVAEIKQDNKKATQPQEQAIKETERKPEPVRKVEPVVEPVDKIKTAESRNVDAPSSGTITEEGAFASLFTGAREEKKISNKAGEAATFKSTSGWQDKKYYVLINDVTPGTIVKISAADKAVYAKVLGGLPEMKDNNGLLLRMSNAAASSLGNIDPKFTVQVTYYQ